ncbi:MAG: DinB superfamily protein [Sphingobacteriales bacterium]|nr:DinB superfamily protein [Sphingobacteriales bacterium]
MSTNEHRKSTLKSVDEYEKLLNSLTDEDFNLSPAPGVWSYSEVYSHIFQANLASLTAAEKCISGTGIKSTKPIHWIARLILFFGRFPPVKLKAPESLASMTSKITREEARNLIIKFKRRLDELAPKVGKSQSYQKIKHPRLGLLNASQWFRFIEIHTLHHQKQLLRIQKQLKKIH